ncbi:MAG TPA: hypothetical protein VN043_00810 [Rhodanobacter sp.]|nr:hypothetical protein [Rhodanobacter sp.]
MSARAWQLAWPWLLMLVVAAAASWLRYGLIESSAIGQQCSSGSGPWWCGGRQWLVWGFLHQVYGIAALIVAVAALCSKRLWLAWFAAALGAFALQLYCVDTGALAWLIGSLRLLRSQADWRAGVRGAPTEPDRRGEQQVQSQP